MRLLGRKRRVGVDVAPDAIRGDRRKEMRPVPGAGVRELAQRLDVVEDPEAAAVRCDHQIVVVDVEIAHRRVRKIQLQRLPHVAVVERNRDGALASRVEQTRHLRIGAYRVHRFVARQAVRDLRPVSAAVVRTIHPWVQIVQAETVDGDVGAVVIEARRVDDRDLAPRREVGWRDVAPMRAAVARDPHQAIVGTGPNRAGVLV